MTGLDPTSDTILSIACYLTTAQLDLITPRPFTAIIYHDPANSPSFANMSAWCRDTHGRSGLSEAVQVPPLSDTAAYTNVTAYHDNKGEIENDDDEQRKEKQQQQQQQQQQGTMTAQQAAVALHDYITTHISTPRIALLAGNSIHADRSFLLKDPWSLVLSYLHPYRLLDVSALKEAARRWVRDEEVLRKTPVKRGLHEAEADIYESIEEARYYRKAIFHS